ncbi:hypothetical protein EDC56_2841 [Sinobacterium caligoides]|uniref:Uncharacterized protein n=1 Tax=Sinobacterium caligoides TaxID=933926 RepID=A0A3N2DK66_9GAMM|nr:hypothetical protein [Sinobacterium caligoides]ROS00203.1 hypothetical protein EDC56_2841 [Sinobacterium caligoides]
MKLFRLDSPGMDVAFSDDEFALFDSLGEGFIMDYSEHEILADRWVELEGVSEIEDISGIDACVMHSRLFLSSRCETLFPVLRQYGELLPFTIKGVRYWSFNCLRKCNDVVSSKTKRNSSGCLLSLSFEGTDANDGELWVTNLDNYTGLYCTESFKNRCEEAGLRGVAFKAEGDWL